MAKKRNARSLLALGVAVAATLRVCTPDANAQPTTLKPGDELRPLYAMSEDIAEGHQLAESSCASCHGAAGVSTTAGVPNLAGQRPAYLYLELKAYQLGGRTNSQMTDRVKFLSDDALVKVAAYYASLDPAQPADATPPAVIDPVETGKSAASSCVGCHGAGGISKTPGTPSLVGLDPQYLISAMKDYHSGKRKNDTMKAMVASLSETDMKHIALYFALQKPQRAGTAAQGDADAGKANAPTCAGCHGDQGVSGNPTTPSLAGQDATYLASALHAYKSAGRANETMQGLAGSLDETAIKNLAAYYAGLEPKPVNVARPLSPDEWAQKCDRCHGTDGNSAQPNIPALAGQRTDYLETVLRDYQTGARRNSEMAAMASTLSDDDIKGLAAHYSHQKARAVVFVTVPTK